MSAAIVFCSCTTDGVEVVLVDNPAVADDDDDDDDDDGVAVTFGPFCLPLLPRPVFLAATCPVLPCD